MTNISTKLMKSSVESIALPMAGIFNSKIRSGIFPDDLKIANVIPLYIFKKFNILKLEDLFIIQ